jgi:hypothetical protein
LLEASPSVARRVLASALAISEGEVTPSKRGFAVDEVEVGHHLESVGRAFAHGFNVALLWPAAEVGARLLQVPAADRGFSFEGAAMALAVTDYLRINGSDWRAQGARVADAHVYMWHVGLGMAWARLPGSIASRMRLIESPLKWLCLDGLGFHEGFFHWRRAIAPEHPRGRMKGYGTRAFDQGLGRSLWFVAGARPSLIRQQISAFSAERRPDLWAGIGLATAYAGGRPECVLEELRDASAEHRPHLQQGVAFAAEARARAGNMVPHTDLAARVLCGMAASAAADLARAHAPNGGDDPDGTRYEAWRAAIRNAMASG